MLRHVTECDAEHGVPEKQLIKNFAQGVTYSYARARAIIALWVARRYRPCSIIEDPEFQELLCMLYPRVEIPSRMTVSRDIKAILDYAKFRLVGYMRVRCYYSTLCMRVLTNLYI